MSEKFVINDADIVAARKVIEGVLIRTPITFSNSLSRLSGSTVFLKLENFQITGSFKARGSLNRLMQLTPEQRKLGIVAASAGNHAQGVAYHAARLGIESKVVMPNGTPFIKLAKTKAYGAEVIVYGNNVDESKVHALELAAAHGYTMIQPFDDPYIIAGQGTIAHEMLEDQPDLDVILVPIGGGGVCAGIAIAAKALKPTLKIYGVESAKYPSMSQAIRGEPNEVGGNTLAEGIAIKHPGKMTLPIIKALVEDIIIVEEEEIAQAIFILHENVKVVAEGAGAVPVAALLKEKERFADLKVGLVICGGNIDPRLTSNVLLQGLIKQHKLAHIRVCLKESPAEMSEVITVISNHGSTITDAKYDHYQDLPPLKHLFVDFEIEVLDQTHLAEIMKDISDLGISVQTI